MFLDLMPGATTVIVPRITNIGTGIQQTRDAFASSWFCETGCANGLQRLGNYRKKWNKALGCWAGEPMHDDNSHGADGYRQFGQTLASGEVFPGRHVITDEDIIFYKTLAPYNPALVMISEVKNGEIYQFDADARDGWRVGAKFAYRRIRTS